MGRNLKTNVSNIEDLFVTDEKVCYDHLFPKAVFNCKRSTKLTKEERQFISKIPLSESYGNLISERRDILNLPELKSLSKWMQSKVNKIFKEMYAPAGNIELKITQSWLNVTNKNQFHHRHNHVNSFLSGVFYIQTGPDDKIEFHRDGYSQVAITQIKAVTIFNSPGYFYPVKENMLIMFPSSMVHEVPKVLHDKQRISLSFDTFPSGELGASMDSKGLNITVNKTKGW